MQSLCNRGFDGVSVLSLCFLELFVGVGAFVIGLIQISSLFSDYFYIWLLNYNGQSWHMLIDLALVSWYVNLSGILFLEIVNLEFK